MFNACNQQHDMSWIENVVFHQLSVSMPMNGSDNGNGSGQADMMIIIISRTAAAPSSLIPQANIAGNDAARASNLTDI